MEDKPMVLTKRQKQALLVMVSDKRNYSELSEGQQRYARDKLRRVLDEKAARAASLRKAGELYYGKDHNSITRNESQRSTDIGKSLVMVGDRSI